MSQMSQATEDLTAAETVHPLRAAVDAAQATLELAQQAFDAIPEPADDCPEGWRASEAEDRLREAQLALCGTDCPRVWELREGGYAYQMVTASSPEEALKVARNNVSRSNYSESEGTLWIDVKVRCDETGEEDSDSVTLEPDEPDCEDGEVHHWESPHCLVGGLTENPGVHGHGGGVIITEVCLKCGCKRVTDTWAQNRETGEQGLRSVSYEEDAYSSAELDEARLELE